MRQQGSISQPGEKACDVFIGVENKDVIVSVSKQLQTDQRLVEPFWRIGDDPVDIGVAHENIFPMRVHQEMNVRLRE